MLGTSACRFHNAAIANAITGQSRYFLLWAKDWFEARGLKVLYGDTDSLFVLADAPDAERARSQGQTMVAELNGAVARHVREQWRVESRLELEFEKVYARLFLPAARHGAARKSRSRSPCNRGS